MKNLVVITFMFLSLATVAQDGGSDQFKVKTNYLQIDSLQEISPAAIRALIVDENGNVGYTDSTTGAVTSVNGETGVVELEATDLKSTGASQNQVPVADGSGGIGWQSFSVDGVWDDHGDHISYKDGYVDIGDAYTDGNLRVYGSIYSTEVKVLDNLPVPDYVFERDYKLMALSELDGYLEKHKHLPEIPSAKEIETDGLDLSEMNLLLLKKVEELTLYIIQQEKRINKLEDKTEKF